jgi:hypothetical protein
MGGRGREGRGKEGKGEEEGRQWREDEREG